MPYSRSQRQVLAALLFALALIGPACSGESTTTETTTTETTSDAADVSRPTDADTQTSDAAKDADASDASDASADVADDARDATDTADAPDTAPAPWPHVAGETYRSQLGFVEYRAGNAPIIISAPHGGYLEPEDIPDRATGTTVRDSYTQELGRLVADAYFEQTGEHPHLILTLLARTKVDTNRDLEEAAQGDPQAEQTWRDFHDYIETAKGRARDQFGEALYIDLHGHGHDVQRVEIGYLLSADELRKSDAELEASTYIEQSSIRGLYEANADRLSFTELLRGPKSMGALLEDAGFASVPSASQPAPESDWRYFSGGYNTRRHGSRDGGPISAIQFEVNQDARFVEENREAFAQAMAEAIEAYLQAHY